MEEHHVRHYVQINIKIDFLCARGTASELFPNNSLLTIYEEENKHSDSCFAFSHSVSVSSPSRSILLYSIYSLTLIFFRFSYLFIFLFFLSFRTLTAHDKPEVFFFLVSLKKKENTCALPHIDVVESDDTPESCQ